MKIEFLSTRNRKVKWYTSKGTTLKAIRIPHRKSTRQSLDRNTVAFEEPRDATTLVMVAEEQNEGNSQVALEEELPNRLKRHEV